MNLVTVAIEALLTGRYSPSAETAKNESYSWEHELRGQIFFGLFVK